MISFVSIQALIVFSFSLCIVTVEGGKLRGGTTIQIDETSNEPDQLALPIPSFFEAGMEIFLDDKETKINARSRSKHGGHGFFEEGLTAEKRIVDGEVAATNMYPFFALMVRRGSDGGLFSRGCSATHIEDEWILTAAHCNCQAGDLAWIGAYNAASSGEMAHIAACFRHPSYQQPNYDFELCRLSKPSNKPKIQIAESDHYLEESQHLTVIGLGATTHGGGSTTQLSYAQVPYISKKYCEKKYRQFKPDNMLCAGGGSADACQGDSGGPIFVDESGELVQVGIVSWGSGCGREGYPGVYADIRTQRSWIDETICREQKNSIASMCIEPTSLPTVSPTRTPTSSPTMVPSGSPTKLPTYSPSRLPSQSPTYLPSIPPSNSPTISRLFSPTTSQLITPNSPTTNIPSFSLLETITDSLYQPTSTPTHLSPKMPTDSPTIESTDKPTTPPTISPTADCKDITGRHYYAGKGFRCYELSQHYCSVRYWKSKCPKTCNSC